VSRWQRDGRVQAASILILSGGSLFLLFADEEGARIAGAICLLMFGGSGLAVAAGRLMSKRPKPIRRGPVELPSGAVAHGLIIPMNAGRMLAGYVAMAFYFAASVMMVVFPQVFRGGGGVLRWVMAGVAIVLAIALAVAIPRFLGPSPVLALTRAGLLSRRYDGTVFFPWDVIRSADVRDYRGQITLAIDVSSNKGIERAGGTRVLGWLDRPILGFDAAIPLVGMALPPDEIAALIQRHVNEPTSRDQLDDA
jgi:hypothetical protein